MNKQGGQGGATALHYEHSGGWGWLPQGDLFNRNTMRVACGTPDFLVPVFFLFFSFGGAGDRPQGLTSASRVPGDHFTTELPLAQQPHVRSQPKQEDEPRQQLSPMLGLGMAESAPKDPRVGQRAPR